MTRHLPLAKKAGWPKTALVLLSGGMDSVAALHWARKRFDEVRSLGFRYGQPQADAELCAARDICERRSIAFDTLHVGEAVRGLTTIGPARPGRANGVSRANLPARNAILLAIAAGHAARLWPDAHISLVVGCNRDDAVGFPDCRPRFVGEMGIALGAALNGVVGWLSLEAPWIYISKAEILAWAKQRPEALEDVRSSLSCYAGTRCGACDACSLRAAAFAAHGIADGETAFAAHGGDPHRAGEGLT